VDDHPSDAESDGEPEPASSAAYLADLDEVAPAPPAKRRRSLTDVMATEKPLPYRHIKRRKRRNAAVEASGHSTRAATVYQQVFPSEPISTVLDAEALPAAHGAYAAKVESDTYGSKKRRTLTELLVLGFQLIRWDGMCVPLLLL
jgi:hypothetical protein